MCDSGLSQYEWEPLPEIFLQPLPRRYAEVRYATDKDSMYILGDDGKEHKFRIARATLKTSQN